MIHCCFQFRPSSDEKRSIPSFGSERMDFRDTPDSAQFVCAEMSPTHVAAHPIAKS